MEKGGIMHQRYPCLTFKRHHYYFRMAVPKRLWILAKCKEICYNLGTSERAIALIRWKREIAKVQLFLDVFESICMKLFQNDVILDAADVDRILLHRLEQIQFFLEENGDEFVAGTKTFDDIKLYDATDIKKNPQQIQNKMLSLIMAYLESLVKKQKGNVTLRTIYTKLQDQSAQFKIDHQDESAYEWFRALSKHLNSLENYTQKSINAIKEDTSYSPSNPKVKSLLRTYDEKKSAERLNKYFTKTPWTKLFKRFVKNKRNLRDVDERTLDANKKSLELVFLLMKKENLEDITEQDCRRLCETIYMVPKRWHEPLKQGKKMSQILVQNPDKALTRTTVKNHLITFKEFMRYAVKEQIIKNSFNEVVELPVKIVKQHRSHFTNPELHAIFNPETYPTPTLRDNMPKFWIPLIALYHGCRINEICQLDTMDVIKDKGISCLSINEDSDDKSVKTEPSKRIIPIHPQLLQLGFLDYVHFQKTNKQKKLFNTLKKHKRNGYADSVQRWFARYLDKVGITAPDKVFHSFRHTFECKAIEKRLHTEHQNALGGWTNKGVGQAVYGRHLSTKVLFGELSKISYPLSKEMKILEQKFKSSYIYR